MMAVTKVFILAAMASTATAFSSSSRSSVTTTNNINIFSSNGLASFTTTSYLHYQKQQKQQKQQQKERKVANLHKLYSSNSDDPVDAEVLSRTTSSTSSSSSSNSLFGRIDNYGMSFKPKAIEAKNKISTLATSPEEGTRTKRFLYTLESCAYFMAFILYRAYRGFFVILPAVFKEVNRKMRDAIDTPFDDDYDNEEEEDTAIVEPAKPKKRTRITVSVLAVIVTASYVVSGAARAFVKFVKTILSSSSVTSSLEAAAEEMISNEDKVMKISSQHDKKKNVNGEGGADDDTPRYAP